jgi:DNA-binding transcriptional regulator YhcF (GntR family)
MAVEDLHSVIIESMERVGTPPEIIYAYRKTGRVVTEENSKQLTKEDLDEWSAAIDEYFEKNPPDTESR